MNVTCIKSGVRFRSEHFGNIPSQGIHPVFGLPARQLVQIYETDFLHVRLSATENKLLFLALLNSTELVTFNVPAAPTSQIIHSLMDSAVYYARYIEDLRNPQLTFPSYVVTRENNDLSNLALLFRRWDAVRDEPKMVRRNNSLAISDWDQFLQSRSQLETLLSQSVDDTFKGKGQRLVYARRLAAWALEASDAPREKLDIWAEIFRANTLEIYELHASELYELYEHMQCKLDYCGNSIYARATLGFLERIIKENSLGLSHGISFEALEPDENDMSKLAQNKLEQDFLTSLVATCPNDKPDRKDFASKSAYTLALMKWQVLQNNT